MNEGDNVGKRGVLARFVFAEGWGCDLGGGGAVGWMMKKRLIGVVKAGRLGGFALWIADGFAGAVHGVFALEGEAGSVAWDPDSASHAPRREVAAGWDVCDDDLWSLDGGGVCLCGECAV